MLRLAACLEEHFPHSMANAVVEEARRRGLNHEERHAKVEYLVAHGIASSVDGEQVRIGSAHFIFEDEKGTIPEGEQAKFDALPPEFSQLYLAIDGVALRRALHLRSRAGGGEGCALRSAGLGREKRCYAHRGQPPHRRRYCQGIGGRRLSGRSAPCGPRRIMWPPFGVRAHRPHGGGRHQRLPGPLRGGCGYCYQ